MVSRIALSFILGASLLSAQALPEHPNKLTYKPLAYHAPLTKDYKTKLKNGIPVYIAPDPSIAFVRLSLMIRGGNYMDPLGKEGLARLCGSQWRIGGTVTTAAEKLDERLDFLAGSVNSSSADTSMTLSLNVLEKDLEEGLKLFMEVFREPAFAQDRLELAKKTMRQGIESRNDSPQRISTYTTSYLLHGANHWYTLPITAASIDAITRDDIKAFHARLLHPSNFVVAVSGTFEKKAMVEKLNAALGSLKPSKEAQVSPKVPAPDHVRTPGIYVVDKDVPQAVVSFVVPGLRRTDPDWFATRVMNEILGGGCFTTRFMKKIRSDEGLTYGIYSQFETGAYYRGDWSCQFQTKNTSVAYALRLALAEIERLKSEPVSDEDLQVVKGAMVNKFPTTFPNKGAIVNTFAFEALTGWPEDYYATYREKVQAITKDDIQRVAKKYLDPTQMVFLVVGKASEVEAGDIKDHPGLLKDVVKLPVVRLPLRDPLTMKPLK